MRLYLVRHTELKNVAGKCVGQSDVALSEKGVADIERLARLVKPLAPTRVVSSDLARCVRLAEAIANQFGVSPELDSAWRELHFGSWENKAWDEIRAQDEDAFEEWTRNFVETPAPDGESFLELRERVEKAMEKLKTLERETVLVVTHAGAMRAALSVAVGVPLERAFAIELNYGALVCLSSDGAQWTLRELNNDLLTQCD